MGTDGVTAMETMIPREVAVHAPRSLDAIYREHVHAIYAFIYGRVGNREIAEDITSEVFIKALAHLDPSREARSVAAWLYRVARNAIDQIFAVFLPLVKNNRLVLTPAPAVENTPPGKLMMAHKSHSSTSLRLVSTKALSLVRNSKPSSSTMAQVPLGASSAKISCTKRTCVALVSKEKFFCASFPSLPLWPPS